MARLPRMAPRVATLRPTLAAPKDEAGRTAHRRKVSPWRAWYNLARWSSVPRGLRYQVLLRDLFMCQMCGRTEPDTSKLVADHKVPHRGDEALFWDAGNVWCLCERCHSSVKQREERQAGLV